MKSVTWTSHQDSPHWNGWTQDNLLIQLAGHLKERARHEWNLLSAISLQQYRLMQAPAVSGAVDYPPLCMAAKAEEKHLAELKQHRQYRPDSRRISMTNTTPESSKQSHNLPTKTDKSSGNGAQRKIAGRRWICDKVGHVAAECRAPNSGDSVKIQSGGNYRSPRTCTCTNQVQTSTEGSGTPTLSVIGTIAQSSNATETTHRDDPHQYLLPDSDEEGVPCVSEIRVKDQGSRPQLVQV